MSAFITASPLLLASIACLIGFVCLAWGADRLVVGSASFAHNYGVSRLFIGLTIVAFGTSVPEMVVSIDAAVHGNPLIAVGNALGSNIANLGLVLGLASLLRPLNIDRQLFYREIPIVFAAMFLAFILLIDGTLNWLNSLALFTTLILIMVGFAHVARRGDGEVITHIQHQVVEVMTPLSNTFASMWIAIGCIMLVLGAELLVSGGVVLASYFGISQLVIGLTVIAIGTSLPELATSIVAALKGEDDIAVGNVLGSNVFNTLAVLPFASLMGPVHIDSAILYRDFPTMFFLTALLLMSWRRKKTIYISRIMGILLLLSYGGYLAWLFIQT